ncbi:hypothetical protein N7539_005012 [Penicillium diatomitis]|uniref:SAP domain-containing protein n=1 Tax=Penicillium diatomitis TaxID=2819901 RepID=A0A9X0BUC2_9EURO|nr:uncharacterized protein N7539_005012 [Penicillium diatomitis]KAJ5485024.1 hypothetical protein N7539_005012 [Penicillium diatomitis]
MRPTVILHASRVPAPPTRFPWLTGLKVVQLQRVARATGIQSSGTKRELTQRIESTLSDHSHVLALENESSRPDWSLLSIDMGIQNLAFAHFHVPRVREQNDQMGRQGMRPVLTAWRRMKVSDIGGLDLEGKEKRRVPHGSGTSAPSEEMIQALSEGSANPSLSSSTSPPAASWKESFDPQVYAESAYTLVTTILSAYRPTHILIERQRFRSGGGSAVQEWTLRVGVFEGMLYAVLNALRRERGIELSDLQVQGIEPKRVVRYWEDHAVSEEREARSTEKDKEKEAARSIPGQGRVTAREVKKAKIDLVGRWIAESRQTMNFACVHGASTGQRMNLHAAGDSKLCLAAGRSSMLQTADAYLYKWCGGNTKENRKKKVSSSLEISRDIGKLDDLADCLLQGMTWLEWQRMRDRLVQDGDGIEALGMTKT